MTEMNHNQMANNACDAFDIIANNIVNKATFDKTIIGNVLSCVDAEIGKYKIKFQDAYYYATVSNEKDTYNKGDSVYILIPNNDLQKEKKIIGLVENLGKGYVASSGIETQFEAAGANVITHSSSFSYPLKTENKEDIEEILYDVNNPENNKLNIDADIFAEFARTAIKLQISARFKTNAPIIYKRGNFGLKFDLEFYADTEFKETTIKTYTLDTNSMIGTFYELADYLKQNAILDFNGAFFKRILKITAFVKDFKYTDKGAEANRIFIDDISILAMIDASSSDWNTYYLKLETPYGTTFNSSVKTLSLVANTTFKNRRVEDDKLEYYWFIRNSAISSNDIKYCEHGGRGWYCLNTHDDEKKKWIPASSIFTINETDMLGASAEYKCVAVKDNIAIAFKEITIYNSEAKYYIEMKSSINGDTFYLDQGVTNITCTVKGSKEGSALNSDNFNFYWGRLNSQEKAVDFIAANGGIPSIDPTIVVGDQQKKTTLEVVNIFKNLKTHFESCFASEAAGNKIENKGKGDRFTVSNYTANVPGLDANIIKVLQLAASETKNEDVYNKTKILLTGTQISYVDKNIFYNLKGNIITEKNTFVCTVYEKDKTDERKERYVGVGKIDIRNISSPQSADYYLTLKNHNQVFKYNQQGKSPTHRTNISPQTILPLSFEFFDKNHTKIDLSKSSSALVKWWIPKENTLIEYIPPEGMSLSEVPLDPSEEYYLINNHKLTFSIADTYDPMKTDNTIFLEVSYNNFYNKQPINLSILKEGQNGTNGTDYYCRITPHTLSTEYPTIYCWENGSEWIVKSNFVGDLEKDVNNVNMIESSVGETDENGNIKQVLNATPWFKCELWNSGSLLTPTSIHWKILGNEGEILTNSPFELISNESSSELYLTVNKTKLDNILTVENPAPFLTIQVEVLHEQKHYYATQPIALVYCGKAQPTRRPRFLKSSGFNEAIYASDGTNPQYASAPFKLEMVNWGNVITDDTSLQDSDIVVWKSYGEVVLELAPEDFSLKEYSQLSAEEREQYEKDNYDNRKCELPSTFNGFKINNGIYCIINNDIKFFFPIHMYLNRYGLSHLNSWDGNSIKISEKEGYILSPQVGAGRKEADNTFTGMLMGEVKGGQGEDKVGLMGYGHGVQTMFLDAETGSAYFGRSGEISIEPKGEDTEVKLGVWNLDKEAIWKGDNELGSEGAGNIYLGNKGFSLSNIVNFDTENQHFKLGPYELSSSMIGSSAIQMTKNGFALGDKLIFEPNEQDEEKYSLFIDGNIDLYNGKLTVTNNPQIVKGKDETEKKEEETGEEAAPDNGEEAPDASEEDNPDTGDNSETSSEFSEGSIIDIEKLQENYKAKINYVTYYNGEEKKNKKEEIDTILSSNVIALSHNKFDNSGNSEYHYNTAYMRYIPGKETGKGYRDSYSIEKDGKTYSYTKGVNHIYFNRGICVPSVRIGEPGVRVVAYDYKEEDGDNQYKDGTLSFSTFFGPNREDCSAFSTNNNRFEDLHHLPRRTYLRGDRLILQAFGQSSKTAISSPANYKGYFKVYAGRTFIYTYAKNKHPYTTYSWTTKSDERAKNISLLDEKYYEFFKKLKPCSYTWKDNPNGPVHIGYSAQQVKQALFDSGLNLNDFAALQIDNDNEEGKKYGIKDFHTLSYEEFGPIYAAVLQRALNKIDELEERIKELEK